LYGNGRGRRPEGTGNSTGPLQAAHVGRFEKRTSMFNIHIGSARKTTEDSRGRPQKVCGVDDHGTQRQNPTFFRRVVR